MIRLQQRAHQICLVATAMAGMLAVPDASAKTIVGRITAVTETSISVKDKRVVTVTIDGRTRYTKWVRQKPWQQNVRLDARSLRIGRQVAVHLRNEGDNVASWIQIATDPR